MIKWHEFKQAVVDRGLEFTAYDRGPYWDLVSLAVYQPLSTRVVKSTRYTGSDVNAIRVIENEFIAATKLPNYTCTRKIQGLSYTDDGRVQIAPSQYSRGNLVTATFAGDDIQNGVPSEGVQGHARVNGIQTSAPYIQQFLTTKEISGGGVFVEKVGLNSNPSKQDYVVFYIYAPSSGEAISFSEGGGEFTKVPSPWTGVNIFAPLQGGDWNLDLKTRLNANVEFTMVVPILYRKRGFFDLDTSTGNLRVNAACKGDYHILDVATPLFAHIPKFPLCPGKWELQSQANAKPMLPHWQWHTVITNQTGMDVRVDWWYIMGTAP